MTTDQTRAADALLKRFGELMNKEDKLGMGIMTLGNPVPLEVEDEAFAEVAAVVDGVHRGVL